MAIEPCLAILADMSENLELVRSVFRGWERGDFAAAEWAAPEFEYVFADGPLRGSSRGLAGIAKAWSDFLAVSEGYRHEATEYRELDGERVLVFVHRTERAVSSRRLSRLLPAQADSAGVFHLGGGKVRKLVIYWDRERALADLGLE